MNQDATWLISEVQTLMTLGFVVFLRVGAAIALFPAFGERSVPLRVRMALAVAFTLLVAPMASDEVGVQNSFRFWPVEVIAGLAIGVLVRLFIHVLQIAGAIAAQSTSLAQVFATAGADPQPAIGHILLVSGLALATILGLHVRLTELLVLSYELIPPGQFPAAGMLSQWGVAIVAHVFALAFTVSAPFVIASLVYNVALGVINRAMPQLRLRLRSISGAMACLRCCHIPGGWIDGTRKRK